MSFIGNGSGRGDPGDEGISVVAPTGAVITEAYLTSVIISNSVAHALFPCSGDEVPLDFFSSQPSQQQSSE